MNAISKRIKTIEKKLSIGNKIYNHIIRICFVETDDKGKRIERYPTEPIEQKPQYIEQMKKPAINGFRMIVIHPDD